MSNEIDKKLFEKIFGHALMKLVDKLVNIKNKEENKIIVKNINPNKKNLANKKKRSLMIMWSNQLIDALI